MTTCHTQTVIVKIIWQRFSKLWKLLNTSSVEMQINLPFSPLNVIYVHIYFERVNVIKWVENKVDSIKPGQQRVPIECVFFNDLLKNKQIKRQIIKLLGYVK